MTKKCSLECRFCSYKFKKVKKGKNKFGKDVFDVITRYHCSHQNVTHSIPQVDCQDYLGHMTLFEHLMHHQPNEVNQLLESLDLRVVGSRNKWGFDIK